MHTQSHETEITMTCGITVFVRADYIVVDGEPEIEGIYQVATGEYLTLVDSDEDKVFDSIMQVIH